MKKGKFLWLSKIKKPGLSYLLIFLLIPFYYILYKLYIPRISAYGCFDDCNNFMGGYFLLQGKKLFSEIFFNHQPMAAYLSYLIQAVTSPINIFELILRHRQFIMLFGFVFNVLLLIRFGLPAFLFAIVFETSKFYLFGDRFLSEGMIVYPLVYLSGLIFLRFTNRKLFSIDFLLGSIFTWLVIFSREPYVPLALFAYVFLLAGKPFTSSKKISIGILLFLSIISTFYHDVSEYFFNVAIVNYLAVLPSDVKADMFGPRFLQSLFYPLYILFYGKMTIFKQILVGIDIVFLTFISILFFEKKLKIAFSILFLLALANIRVVIPGSMFFEAFHMLVWFGMFVFITLLLFFYNSSNRPLLIFVSVVILLFLTSFLTSKSYFAYEKVDRHVEYITNYGPILQMGSVIDVLASPGDTLFLDGSDDLVYWQAQHQNGAAQAKVKSSYKYSWYTSAMIYFEKYKKERLKMFKENSPDFYKEYGFCNKIEQIPGYSLPDFVKKSYVRLNADNKPSCLFVKKSKLDKISSDQWRKAKDWLYENPSE